MPRPSAKSLRSPEQIRRFPNGRIETVSHNETTIGRFLLEPGWRWSRDVGPIARTRFCQVHRQGVVLRRRLHLETDAGEVCEVGIDDVYDIPAGHDGWVIGNEPFEAIEFASARVLVSATTRLLLAGSGLEFESAGMHELRGLGDARELFRLAGSE